MIVPRIPTPTPLPRAALVALLGAILALVLSACGRADRGGNVAPAPVATAQAAGAGASPLTGTTASSQNAGGGEATRRIIRTADLSVETDAPEAAVTKLTALANDRGGFVVSSDTARLTEADGAQTVTTTLVFRVPAAAFDEALAAVRTLGKRVANEKVTGQDVTEEYVDLEARIRAQQALEAQYLAILKDAKTIPDTLAVQQKLGEVRTEIERAEGRRRYLDNQSSLSTITVHVARTLTAVDVSGPGFGRSVTQAAHDAVEVSIGIINGFIRLVGVLLPIGVLIVLPAFLLTRLWWRRRKARLVAAWAGPAGGRPAGG